MKKWPIFRKSIAGLAGLVAFGYLHIPSASAQDRMFSQINAEFSAVRPGNSSGISGMVPGLTDGTTLTDQGTHGSGWDVKYGYQFDHWMGVDAGFGMTRYTQNYTGSFGASSVESNLHEGMIDFVLHIPIHEARIHPYLLSGAGYWRFDPTNNMNNAAGASGQTRSAFIFGAGGDFDITKKIGIRAEYRGSRFMVPSFQVPELDVVAQTHISQPTIGVYYKFSGLFGKGKSGAAGH